MCGIVGLCGASLASHEIDGVAFSASKLAHRGPDGNGLFVDSERRVVLGHTRLAIIDTLPRGDQPMESACGRYVIVFNGEIYNYRELRSDLEQRGEVFVTRSDTEVLLRSFARWGTECLQSLNGMFAFAIFDRGNERDKPRLILARDRVGEKPLYFQHRQGKLSFASELKALPGRGGNIDDTALEFYLSLGYVPDSYCIVEGANKLQPGTIATFDIQTGELSRRCYWTLPMARAHPTSSREELKEEALSILQDAVRIRLRADVPLGIMLSGGLDSSILASLAAKHSNQRLEAFTIGVPGSPLDETPQATKLAKLLGLTHHVLPLSRPSLDALEMFAEDVDEPLGDSSFIPALLVSELAASRIKVAIAGDGGDEVFGGYNHYRRVLKDTHRFALVPPVFWKTVATVADAMPVGIRGRGRLLSLREGPKNTGIWRTSFFDPVARRRLRGNTGGSRRSDPEAWRRFRSSGQVADLVEREMRRDFRSTLPDDYLVKIDRTSMRFGLEMRTPYLDHRLVEFAYTSLPPTCRVSRLQTRILQLGIAQRVLPSGHSYSKKQGFSIPLDDWLRTTRCGEFHDLLDHLPLQIDRQAARELTGGLMRGRANGARIFALMMLALGCRNLRLSG